MNELEELKSTIKKLEKRSKTAISELHHLINEQVHRLHGCPYPEVDIEDLEGVISILEGTDEV